MVPRRSLWSVESGSPKSLAHALADLAVRNAPDRYVAKMTKSARQGKTYIDYLRKGRGATSVAPYSTRARPGAPVSVPLDGGELDSSQPPFHFTMAYVPERLAGLRDDPWAAISQTRQRISIATRQQLERELAGDADRIASRALGSTGHDKGLAEE
jgi:bifunctional non-homologous end joining protein LigD